MMPQDGGYHIPRDPVIEAYKKDIDRTLLRENLKRTVAERMANLMELQRLAEEARRAVSTREDSLSARGLRAACNTHFRPAVTTLGW